MTEVLTAQTLLVHEGWNTLESRCISCGIDDIDLIRRAFEFANKTHEGVVRKSGEPYIMHPLAVAEIVLDTLKNDSTAIAATLLHDVIEDSDVTYDNLASEFNPEIAQLVQGLTKISKKEAGKSSQQLLNYEKLLRSMEDGFRIIIIKLADRLHNMETLESLPKDKQEKIANETIYFYIPIAERLGLYKIKSQLDDLALKHTNPEGYKSIELALSRNNENLKKLFSEFEKRIRGELDASGIAYELTGRQKSIASIWRKMQRKKIPFKEVYDLLAMRIVFTPIPDIDEGTQCWYIYTLLTNLYPAVKGRIRNWVSSPKVNGYEALHCTLISPNGGYIEVQIRSERMDEQAEYGAVSHWRYKGEKRSKELEVIDSLRSKIIHTGEVNAEAGNAKTYVDDVRYMLFSPQIMVYDAVKETTHYIMRGSSVLDFAYILGAEIGNKALGAKVNGVLTMLNQIVQAGDRVEILTAHSQRPSRKWLDIVQTPYAKGHIEKDLQLQKKELNQDGRLRIQAIFDHLKQPFSLEKLESLLAYFSVQSVSELYEDVANGKINPYILKKRLRKHLITCYFQQITQWIYKLFSRRNTLQNKEHLNIDNHTSTQKRKEQDRLNASHQLPILQSPCCFALPGDDVKGIFNEEQTAIIAHKSTCNVTQQLLAQYVDQTIKIDWKNTENKLYRAHIFLSGEDRKELLADIFSNLADQNTENNICHVFIESDNSDFQGVISILVHNTKELEKAIKILKQIQNMHRVYRIDTPESYAGK